MLCSRHATVENKVNVTSGGPMFRAFLLILVLAVLCNTAPPVVAQNMTASEAHEFGLYLMEHGKVKDSIEYFNKAIQKAPDMSSAYMNRGCAYDDIGDGQKALTDFNRAIELDPGCAPCYANRALTLMRITKYEQALPDIEKSLLLRPNHARSYAMRGTCYLALHKLQDALKDFDQALKLDPNERVAVGGRAEALSQLGKSAEAQADYARYAKMLPGSDAATAAGVATLNAAAQDKMQVELRRLNQQFELTPEDPKLLAARSSLYLRMGKSEESVADANKALKLDPKLTELYKTRGEAYVQLKQYTKGIEDLDKAISLNPSSTALYLSRGSAYHSMGNYKFALRDFDKGLEIDPKDGRLYLVRGATYMTLAMYPQATADFNKWVDLNPKYANAYVTRADAYLTAGRYDEALADTNQALKLDPEELSAYSVRGQAYAALGKTREAMEDLSRSLRKSPDDERALLTRAKLFASTGDHRSSLIDLNRLLTMSPKSNAPAYALRASIEQEMGQPEKAHEDVNAGIAINPHNPLYYLLRSSILVELKKFDEAKIDIDSAAKIAGPGDRMVKQTRTRFYVARGKAAIEKDEWQVAIDSFTEALTVNPDSKEAKLGRSLAYLGSRELDKSIADVQDVEKFDPKNITALIVHAKALAQSRNPQQAVEYFDKSAAVDPEISTIYSGRGVELFKLGRYEESFADAQSFLQKVGWEDPFAPYMALIGFYAAKHAKDDAAGQKLLEEAKKSLGTSANWPQPLIEYSLGEMSESNLLAKAKDKDQLTEAHTYIGLNQKARAKMDQAKRELLWVKDNGNHQFIEYALALNELDRMDKASAKP